MGSIVAELAEKISSATNNFSVDAQVLYVDTVNDEVGVNTTTPDGAFSIHQSGTDDIFNLYDGTDNVTTVVDGGALTHKGTLTVGVDDTGHDVKFFGATSGAYMLWDESADDLILAGASGLTISGTGKLGIGTSSPTVALEVKDTGNQETVAGFGANDNGTAFISVRTAETQNNTAGIAFETGTTTPTGVGSSNTLGYMLGKVMNSSGALQGELQFFTNDGDSLTQKMVIMESGYVGIGVTAPNTTLQVGGSCKLDVSLGVGTDASGTTGEIRATNNVTAYYSSDIALKENISPIGNALDKLSQISGVEFDWTKDYIDDHGGEDGYFVRKHDVGVIAQEIKKVLPEVVAERQDGTLAVRYEKIIALLIEAVKELKGKLGEK